MCTLKKETQGLDHRTIKMNFTLHNTIVTCNVLGLSHFTLTKLPSHGMRINHFFLIALDCLLMIMTAFLNAVAILTIQKSSQLKEKPCYFIILLQSFIDLICSLAAMPIFLVFLLNTIKGTVNCVLNTASLLSLLYTVGFSNVNLFALTWERHISILYPYDYNTKVTKTKLFVGVSAVGVIDCVAKTAAFIVDNGLVVKYNMAKIAVLFCYLFFVYMRIYFVVRKIKMSTWKLSDSNDTSKRTKTKLLLKEIKIAKSCFIVAVFFFLLYIIPASLLNIITPYSDRIDQLVVIMWITVLAFSNSSVNSIVFFWSRKMLRKEATKLFCKKNLTN